MGLKRGHSTGWSVLALGLGFTTYMIVLSQAVPTDRLSKRFETNRGTNNTYSRDESCESGNKFYKRDEIVKDNAGPCEECVCKPPDIQCAMVSCPVKTGCKIIQRPNECCPQFQCDCEFNGKNYFNGEQIEAQVDKPCEKCYCKGGDVMCTSITCYERSDCQAKIVPGQCCPKYENCPPRELKEPGRTEKTEGGTDNDSKTKKREMQPWLLTNPAEEVERHETTAMNALTTGNTEDSSTPTPEEKTTITSRISSSYVDNPSTEYRLFSDNSEYGTTIVDISSLETSLNKTITNVSVDLKSTEAYDSSTQPLKDESEANNSSINPESLELSTIKDDSSSGTIELTTQLPKLEKINNEIARNDGTESAITALEYNTDQPKPSTESVGDAQGHFRTELIGNIKKLETTDSDSIATNPTTTPNLEATTLDAENHKQETNSLLGASQENSESPEFTTHANLPVINQDFKNLNVVVNNDDADLDFTRKENETSSSSLVDAATILPITTDVNLEGRVTQTSVRADLMKVKSQTDEQAGDQAFSTETPSVTENPSTITPHDEKDKYKVHLTIGEIEEKATVESQSGFQAQNSNDTEKSEQTDASDDSNTYTVGLSTLISEKDDSTTLKADSSIIAEATTDIADKVKLEKLEAEMSEVLSTTESAAETKRLYEELTTKIDSINFEKETEKKKDENNAEESRTTEMTAIFYSTQQLKNNERTELSITATEKISSDLVENAQIAEEPAIEKDKSDRNELKLGETTTQESQFFTPTDETTNQKYIVTDVIKTDENTDAEQTTSDSNQRDKNSQMSEEVETTSIHVDIVTSKSEVTSISSPLKLVASSVTSANTKGNNVVSSHDQQNEEEATLSNLGVKKEDVTSTTDISFTTIIDENKMDIKGSAQGFDKDTFLNAQLSPDRNQGMENLNVKNEMKITTEPSSEKNDLPVTNFEADKEAITTEHYTTLAVLQNKTPLDSLSDSKNLTNLSIKADEKLVASSTPPIEEYTLTEDPKLVQSILNLAISMQTPNDNLMGIQPPQYIPIKYIGQTNESKLQENLQKSTELGKSTTPMDKNITFPTYSTEKVEETTEYIGDTKLVEQQIVKHVQNLTQIALAPVANKLYNLVSKNNKTKSKNSSASNIQDEIILPKDSEIERIADQIKNATIQSFQDSFETLEETLGDDQINPTNAPKLTSQPVKPKTASVSRHKVRRRRYKVKTKK